MKTAPAVILASALCAAVPADATEGCTALEVQQVRPQQGQLMVVAYASADSWRKKPLASMRLPAGEATMRFSLCGLGAAEEVALMLFQDLDSDGRMGFNAVGMPIEPWGSSGTPGAFGPSWETGRVRVGAEPIVVRMSQ